MDDNEFGAELFEAKQRYQVNMLHYTYKTMGDAINKTYEKYGQKFVNVIYDTSCTFNGINKVRWLGDSDRDIGYINASNWSPGTYKMKDSKDLCHWVPIKFTIKGMNNDKALITEFVVIENHKTKELAVKFFLALAFDEKAGNIICYTIGYTDTGMKSMPGFAKEFNIDGFMNKSKVKITDTPERPEGFIANTNYTKYQKSLSLKAPDLSKEDLDMSPDQTETVYFDTNYPYDCAKIIASTLLGEPRLSFKTINGGLKGFERSLVATRKHDNRYEEVYRVKTDYLKSVPMVDLEYGDTVRNASKVFTDLHDFGKLFYLFGRTGLARLSGIMMGQDAEGMTTICSGEFNLFFNQLFDAVKESWPAFMTIMGVEKEHDEDGREIGKSCILLKPENLGYMLEDAYGKVTTDSTYQMEFGKVFAILYLGTYLTLFGSTIKIITDSILNPALIFNGNEDITEGNLDKFAQVFLGNESLDKESKQRYIGLLIAFTKMTDFYNAYNGFTIGDPSVKVLYKLGASFAETENEEFLEFVDQTLLTQSDIPGYTINLASFLEPTSFIETPAMFRANLLQHDQPSKFTIAAGYGFIGSELWLTSYDLDKDEIESPILNILKNGTDKSKFTDEGTLIALYDYIVNDLLANVPNVCSPRYYHILVWAAATYRYILSNQGMKTSLKNKGILPYVTLGLWHVDGMITFLFHEWFRDGKFYQVEGVHTADDKAVSKFYKAESYVICDLTVYLNTCIQLYPGDFNIEKGLNSEEQKRIALEAKSKIANKLMEEYFFQTPWNSVSDIATSARSLANTGNRTLEIYTAREGKLTFNTHLSGTLPFDSDYQDMLLRSYADKHKIKYETIGDSERMDPDYLGRIARTAVFNGHLPPIYIYAHYGLDASTGGLFTVKNILENKGLRQMILESISKMANDNPRFPMLIDDDFSHKVSQNIFDIIEGKLFPEDETINEALVLLFRTVLFVGWAKESLYQGMDKPYYVESIPADNVRRISPEINSDSILPVIQTEQKFNFLSKR